METQHIGQVLETITSLEPAKQELKRLVNGDENKLAVALFSPKIIEAEVENLKEVLRLVMVKVGLRAQNWPNDLEKVILIQHIRDNFSGNTVDEIRLAFDMAIGGKLEIETKEIACYENFSCLYFSKIMNAYRLWSAEAIHQVPIIDKPEQKIFTDAELEDSFREDAERQYQTFLRKNELRGLAFNKAILVKDGFMKEDEDVLGFFKKRALSGKVNIYTRS